MADRAHTPHTDPAVNVRRRDRRDAYAAYKAAGVCIRCHKRDALPGLVMCSVCREAVNAAQNRRKKSRRKAGRCVACGMPHDGTKKLCPECAEKQRLYSAGYKARAIASGFCPNCGQAKRAGDGYYCWACRLYHTQKRHGAASAPRDKSSFVERMRELAYMRPRDPITRKWIKSGPITRGAHEKSPA